MKTTFLCVFAAAFASVAIPVRADDPEELPAAAEPFIIRRFVRVNETLPELGARLYDQVDYELRRRQLDNDIKLAKAHLAAKREQAYVYDKYFSRTSVLFVTRQNAHLAVLETELRLQELTYEKLLLLRHRPDQVRYRKLIFAAGNVRLNLDN